MKRVASLYLPDWSIDRLRRSEPALAPPPERALLDVAALKAAGDREQGGKSCDAPRNSGWRPGARWARAEVDRQVAALPAHQRPPLRELGRRSEAAAHPYKRLPGDDGGKASGWPEPNPSPGSAERTISVRRERNRDTCRARPLVTTLKTGSRIQIAAASPEARALGIEPGMALTQVRAATPDIAVRDADPDGDARDLHRLAIALARRWSPAVAIADAQSLFIDLTGVAHLHGGERAMAARIVRLLARLGITARIAVADTAGAAWACAHFAAVDRDGVALMAPGDPLAALAPLPVAALRVDDAALELLRRLGIDTVGQLAAVPRAPLVRRFGRAIAQRLDQAGGRVAEPVDPIVPPVAIVVEQRFMEPLLTADPIAYWIGRLVRQLSIELAKAGRGARSVVLAATRVDGAVQTIRIGLARPTRTPDHLLRLLVRGIERIDPGFGIELLSLHVLRADPLGAEAFDGDLADGEQADMAPLVDAIVNRIGARRLWRASAVESDVPERSVAGAAPLDPPDRAAAALRRDDVRRLDRRAPAHPWHPRWPRPARLLVRPEPVDGIIAGLPDEHPRRFTWRGTTHRVVCGDGPERITGEWWRRSAERHAVRDYYRVEDEEGRRFWLFRRGDAERAETGDLTWYMHGTFG